VRKAPACQRGCDRQCQGAGLVCALSLLMGRTMAHRTPKRWSSALPHRNRVWGLGGVLGVHIRAGVEAATTVMVDRFRLFRRHPNLTPRVRRRFQWSGLVALGFS